MSTQAERRQAELAAKLQLLRDELDFWQQLAEENGTLEKHHTQLLRLGHVLGSALDQLDGQRVAVDSWTATTEQLLGVHHVWDFFRSKLALRLVDRFQPALIAADELAWSCVGPLYDVALGAGTRTDAELREPALVYFDSSGTPFAQGRRQAYRNLLPAKRLSDVPAELAKQLPVPVIGVPWHQQAHLPETAVIAHEAAHLVDDDLDLCRGLLPVLEQRLGDEQRLAQWSLWFPEVLADVLAVLWLGPAYGQALSDLVAASAHDAGQTYPPAVVRLLLVEATLELLKYPSDGPRETSDGAAAPYASDVADVVDVIVCTPLGVLGDAPLRRFDPFTAIRQAQVVADAERLGASVPPVSRDPRVLIAAGVRAFSDDPDGFVARGTAASLFKRIASVRDAGTRAADHGAVTRAVEARDRRHGADLFTLLAQERSETAGSPSTT